MESKILCIGNIWWGGKNGNVYLIEGLSPTIMYDCDAPKILVKEEKDEDLGIS